MEYCGRSNGALTAASAPPPPQARLPKLVCLSSDDEFMMMDWSELWYDQLEGEKHLLIAPNSEHSLSTGFPEVVKAASYMLWSIGLKRSAADRPGTAHCPSTILALR